MKRIISVLLCMAMLFVCLTVFASAESSGELPESSLFVMLIKLLQGVNWDSIKEMIDITIQTLMHLFGMS